MTDTDFIKRLLLISIISLLYSNCHSQLIDSLLIRNDSIAGITKTLDLKETMAKMNDKRQHIKSLIFPASLITYGVVALENDKLKSLDNWVKEEVWKENPHHPAHFDDALQYMPGLSVYVLNCLGVAGKNNLLDATRQYLISSFLMMVVVQSGKAITRLRRPDGFGTNTFPGGHTATAFVAAEFLHQEFKDKSPLISLSGYAMAAIVGYMRIYNNRHWLKDDIAGAGIGIGITRLVYWAYPAIKKKLFKDRPMNARVMPYFQNSGGGISMVYNFH